MENLINSELTQLQEELLALDAAVKHIEKAGAVSTEVIESVRAVQAKYGEHLQEVMDYYAEYLKNTYTSYQGEVLKVSEILESHKKQIAEVQTLINSYIDLAKNTQVLANQIKAVDFPTRLDKLAEVINENEQNFLNTQTLIVHSEKSINETNQLIQKRIRTQNRKINLLISLVFILLLAFAGAGVWYFLNYFDK